MEKDIVNFLKKSKKKARQEELTKPLVENKTSIKKNINVAIVVKKTSIKKTSMLL